MTTKVELWGLEEGECDELMDANRERGLVGGCCWTHKRMAILAAIYLSVYIHSNKKIWMDGWVN